MYLRHFALTRLAFETPAHTDELFESNSRREAEARLQHLIELKGIGLQVVSPEVWLGTKTHRRRCPPVLTTPDIAKRQEKRIEEGDELATRQRAGASVHLELGENTLLTAGTASRRGTRLSSMPIL